MARHVVDELSYDPLLRGRVTFDLISWDDPEAAAPMTAGLTPHEAVNRGILPPSACDVVVIVLWSRMGTPLSEGYKKPDGQRYESGVEWEYENAYTASPQPDILVFRKTQPVMIDVDDPLIEEKIHQRRSVAEFFRRFQNADGSFVAAYNTYDTPEAFSHQLAMALRVLVHRRVE